MISTTGLGRATAERAARVTLICLAILLTPVLAFVAGPDSIVLPVVIGLLAAVVALMRYDLALIPLFGLAGLFVRGLQVPLPYTTTGTQALAMMVVSGWAARRLVFGNGARRDSIGTWTALDRLVAAYVVALVVGAVVGYMRDPAARAWFGEFKEILLFILLFFPARDLFSRDASRRLFRLVLVPLIVAVSGAALYGLRASSVESAVPLEINLQFEHAVDYAGMGRIAGLTPDNYFQVMPVLLVALLASTRSRPLRLLFLAVGVLYLLALAVDLTRTRWIGAVLSLAWLWIVSPEGTRRRRWQAVAATLAMVAIGWMAIWAGTERAGTNLPSAVRAHGDIESPTEILRLGSLDTRLYEAAALFEAFTREPLLGGGLGLEIDVYTPYLHEVVRRTNWHNDYMMLLGKLGLLGLLSYLAILVAFFRAGFFVLRVSKDAEDRTYCWAFMAVFFGYLVTANSISSFTQVDIAPFNAIMLAYVAAAAARARREQGAGG